MADRVYIKPTDGRLVRNPLGKQALPAEGAYVAWNSYWQRRLAEGAVAKAKPPKTDNKADKE